MLPSTSSELQIPTPAFPPSSVLPWIQTWPDYMQLPLSSDPYKKGPSSASWVSTLTRVLIMLLLSVRLSMKLIACLINL